MHRGVEESDADPLGAAEGESKTRDPAGCVPTSALSLRDEDRGARYVPTSFVATAT
jgi:hypothetical protein